MDVLMKIKLQQKYELSFTIGMRQNGHKDISAGTTNHSCILVLKVTFFFLSDGAVIFPSQQPC